MSDFEQLIEKAIVDEDIPGCVLHAINRDGTFKYAKAFGYKNPPPTDAAIPLRLDTVMWIASCTKLMTSICALQLVERGKLTLDEPVYQHIPELKDFPVITSIKEDGTPIEEPHKNPITLRTLLTHTSGLGYPGLHPKLIAWSKYHKKSAPTSGKLLERFLARPLIFEPGEGWIYGPNIDFVGLLIERVTNLSLEDFMRQNLWEPLGVKDMTFYLSKRPDLKDRMAVMSFRNTETGKVVLNTDRLSLTDGEGNEVEDCMGGQGVCASVEEYIKILHALLTSDEDQKILKKETVDLFFSPQLGTEATGMLNFMLQNDMANNAMGGTPKDFKKDWGLGGLLVKDDLPDGKKAGTMIWGGLPNLIWWCDRKAGLTGLYAGQVLPTGDSKCAALNRKFEAAMYELYEQHQKSGAVSPRL